MRRSKLTLLAFVTLVGLVRACTGIPSPNRDGEEETGRCQVVQGSDTRQCSTDTTSNG